MSAHTPGPWEPGRFMLQFKVGDEVFAVVAPQFHGDGLRIRTVAICGDTADEKLRSTSEADAWLIAAAPDLLHASVEALNALLDYVDRLERGGGVMGYGNAVIAKLRAAITKAEGR